MLFLASYCVECKGIFLTKSCMDGFTAGQTVRKSISYGTVDGRHVPVAWCRYNLKFSLMLVGSNSEDW